MLASGMTLAMLTYLPGLLVAHASARALTVAPSSAFRRPNLVAPAPISWGRLSTGKNLKFTNGPETFRDGRGYQGECPGPDQSVRNADMPEILGDLRIF